MAIAALAAVAFPAVSQAESPQQRRSLCDIGYPSDATVEWGCRTLRSGESLEKSFGARWTDVARFNRIDRRHARAGVSIKVPDRIGDLEVFTPLPLSYPVAAHDERFILIDLSEQFLGASEHGALRFHVNREGMSYWIHGRDLPGYPASHGCIGLYDEPMQKEQYGVPKDPELNDAKRLFE